MLSLKIDTRKSAKLLKLLKTAPREVENAIQIGLIRIGHEMKNRAGRNAPYLSGNLRRSITDIGAPGNIWIKKHYHITVGTNLVYARIHEYGGMAGRGRKVRIPKYKGRGYFKPAFDVAARKATRIMNQELDHVIR